MRAARTIGLVACALSVIVPVALTLSLSGGPLVLTGDGTPAAWDPDTPVPYSTDRGGMGGLTEADAVTLTASLFGRWQDVPTAAIMFARDGSLPVNVGESNFGPYLGPFGGSGARPGGSGHLAPGQVLLFPRSLPEHHALLQRQCWRRLSGELFEGA